MEECVQDRNKVVLVVIARGKVYRRSPQDKYHSYIECNGVGCFKHPDVDAWIGPARTGLPLDLVVEPTGVPVGMELSWAVSIRISCPIGTHDSSQM